MSKKLCLSDLVDESLDGLSPIQTIMKMAEDRNIVDMGLNPDDVISFGGGWCNHKAPQELVDSYNEILSDPVLFHKSGRYSSILGSYHLREQLCFFEKEIFQVKDMTPENILIGHSSTHLCHEVMRLLANPGDTICFLDPTYANYENSVNVAINGAKMFFVPGLDVDSWEYMPDPDSSLEILKKYCSEEKTRVFMLPVPDNPTSQIPSEVFMKGALEIMQDYNGFLVLDYAYKELWFGDKKPSCFSWSPVEYPNLLTIHSNSKWLSSLGRRLGWVEASEHVISSMEKLNESVLLSPDTFHSMATAGFLEKTLNNDVLKNFIEETRNLYEKTSKVMTDSIKDLLGWKQLLPKGGLYTVCPIPNKKDSVSFVEDVLKNTGVLLIPGKGFGPSMDRAVRLSYGPLCYDHDSIVEGIERISKYVKK